MMDFETYQHEAAKTDVSARPGYEGPDSLIVPMLGLAGETGQLLTEFKKHIRDGEAHKLFKSRVAEELGDLLWYISNVATRYSIKLDDIAIRNLEKTRGRWKDSSTGLPVFDAQFPDGERIPRQFFVSLAEEVATNERPRVRMQIGNQIIGSVISDNSYDPDGYRFHDVFHLAYVAVLGWSPNIRAFLKRKRKSKPLLDEVEDGGRARVIEEAISALAFDYARAHNFLVGVTEIDYELLRTIMSMVSHLEVASASPGDWERAIFCGFEAWRSVVRNRGGMVKVDLDGRSIEYVEGKAIHR